VPLTTRRILMRHAAAGVTDEHYSDARLIGFCVGRSNKLPALAATRLRPEIFEQAAANVRTQIGPKCPLHGYGPVYGPIANLCKRQDVTDKFSQNDGFAEAT